jgi:acetyl esterase/lipase
MSQDTNPEDKTVYQPIHSSIRAKLDPEYVHFHDNVLAYIKPSEQVPWQTSARDEPSPFAQAAQKSSAIGSQTDHDARDFQVRVFTPRGPPPTGEGWPVLVWFHGGGFVMGGLDSENGFLTHVCRCESLLSRGHIYGCVAILI